MRYVLDASTALSFVLDDERDDTADFMLSTLRRASVLVPVIWRYEVANGLINAVRRRRLDEPGLDEALALLDRLDIEHDADPPALAGALRFARAHALTAYDALYLLLARREGLALISRDADMVRAAQENGVRVM
jgi:predicted nucleic acid-binding protein